MKTPVWPRRTFLRNTVQGLASFPMLASLRTSRAQTISKRAASSKLSSPPSSAVHLNVRTLGQAGDGKRKDTQILQQALDRCNLLGGGEVFIPVGDYLTGALTLRSNVTLRLDEGASLLASSDLTDYTLTLVRWEGHFIQGYPGFINAHDAVNIAISGKGKIVGNPDIKGRLNRQTRIRNPALLEFTGCTNVRVEDCFTQQNDMWSIHPLYCENVTFKNVAVHGGADGIDVDSCKHVVIDGCEFVTGDDCISLKSGRGMEGLTIGRPTEDVTISNCTFSDSHFACIGIGSETSAGIRKVLIEHCKCIGAKTHAIYIKSRPGRGAFIEDITVRDFEAANTGAGFLRFNFLNSGLQDEHPVPSVDGIPTVRNFRFSDIRVKDVPVLVDGTAIHPDKPLDGLLLAGITGTCAKGILLANIHHAQLRDIHVTGFTGPLLSTHQVTGTGLAGAASLDAPKLPDPIPAAAQPFLLQ